MTTAQRNKLLLDQPVVEPLRTQYNEATGLSDESTVPVTAPVTTPTQTQTSQQKTQALTVPSGYTQPVTQSGTTSFSGYNVSAPQFTYNAEAPKYASPYGAQIDAMLAQLEAGGSFEYDYTKDPDYEAYRQIYTDAGRRAMEDTVGTVAASTGGIASSYATSAGQQAYNGYMAQLAGVIPELSANAYTRWANERQDDYNRLSTLMNLENTEYNKYLGELSQYNTDREYAYNQYLNERNYLYQLERDAIEDQRYDEALEYERMINDRDFEYQQLLNDRNYQYQLDRDSIEDQRYNDELAYNRDTAEKEFEYQKYLNDLNYQYQLGRDEIEDQRYNDAWNYEKQQNDIAYDQWLAEFNAAQSQDKRDRLFDEAVLAAEYGDLSRLKALGIDTSAYETTVETDDYDPLSTDVIDTILAQAQKFSETMKTVEGEDKISYALNQMFRQGQITYSQYLSALNMYSENVGLRSGLADYMY